MKIPSPLLRECAVLMMEGRYGRNPALAGFVLQPKWCPPNYDTASTRGDLGYFLKATLCGGRQD